MTEAEHEIPEFAKPLCNKKVWQSPEVRDQSIKSATTKAKAGTTEAGTGTGPAS